MQVFLLLMHARTNTSFVISITVIVLHVFGAGTTSSITSNAPNFTGELQLALVPGLLYSGLGTDCGEGCLVLDLVHYEQRNGPLACVFVPS